jgi:hypothetical protein
MKLRLRSGTAIDFPHTPNDVTLSQYIRYHNDVQPTMPKEVVEYGGLVNELEELNKELEKWYEKTGCNSPYALQVHLDEGHPKNNVKRLVPGLLAKWNELVARMEHIGITTVNDPVWISKHWHPYQLATVKCFLDIDEELTVDELQYLFKKCTTACLQPKEVAYKQLYLHDGVTYTLPDELMRNSTLIEFAEAAQYESALKQTQGGDANGLLKMCAVLLRPVGVTEYSEELFESNVKAFQTLPLQVAYEVAFFLTWLSAKFAISLNHSILREAVEQLQN